MEDRVLLCVSRYVLGVCKVICKPEARHDHVCTDFLYCSSALGCHSAGFFCENVLHSK